MPIELSGFPVELRQEIVKMQQSHTEDLSGVMHTLEVPAVRQQFEQWAAAHSHAARQPLLNRIHKEIYANVNEGSLISRCMGLVAGCLSVVKENVYDIQENIYGRDRKALDKWLNSNGKEATEELEKYKTKIPGLMIDYYDAGILTFEQLMQLTREGVLAKTSIISLCLPLMEKCLTSDQLLEMLTEKSTQGSSLAESESVNSLVSSMLFNKLSKDQHIVLQEAAAKKLTKPDVLSLDSQDLRPICQAFIEHNKKKESAVVSEKEKEFAEVLENSKVEINEKGEVSAHVSRLPFSQGALYVTPLPEELRSIDLRFNGLCEIICNKIIMDDLLEKGTDQEFLKKKVTVEELNKDPVVKSHLLNVFSILLCLVAFLFGVYPDNIFSFSDQWRLMKSVKSPEGNEVNEINTSLLKAGLAGIENETTLKLEVFSKRGASFSGHSLLVKKVKDDNFVFFDPNEGEFRNLTVEQLMEKIQVQVRRFNGTDIYLTRGSDYLKRMGIEAS